MRQFLCAFYWKLVLKVYKTRILAATYKLEEVLSNICTIENKSLNHKFIAKPNFHSQQRSSTIHNPQSLVPCLPLDREFPPEVEIQIQEDSQNTTQRQRGRGGTNLACLTYVFDAPAKSSNRSDHSLFILYLPLHKSRRRLIFLRRAKSIRC